MKNRKNTSKKSNKVNISEDVMLAENLSEKINNDEYNYVENLNNWTTKEEQTMKTKEIERITE